MKYKQIYKIELLSLLILTISFMFSGCDDSVLDKYPLDELSTSTFWTDVSDADLGLTGVYSSAKASEEGNNFYGFSMLYLDAATDNGALATLSKYWLFTNGDLDASNTRVKSHWSNSYTRIATANNFLENIYSCDMDDDERDEMIGEVQFMRAWQYFWLTQFFGDVPLVKKVLTTSEANSLIRTSVDVVETFIEEQLDSAINVLPDTRDDDEDGRIVKAAAQVLKGRLLMAQERWSEASEIFKDIINSGNFSLDSRYKELFEDAGEGSDEIIYSIKYIEDDDPTTVLRPQTPVQFGGYGKIQPFNDLVKAYDMIDGLPQDESDLYDPENPYINKDPRLSYTVFLPDITEYQGSIYTPIGTNDFSAIKYGYALKKYLDEDFDGSLTNYGSDFPMIRYAEVLLSYLECEFEANNGNVTQALLDETVNAVRARDAVDMPAINLADFTEDRMRNERRVELAWEGLRYWDILRWKIADEVCTGEMKSIYLTDDPDNYSGYPVDEDGYRIIGTKAFKNPTNYLWPIPQTEIDINPALEQNNGY
jgi:hypothetical protein